MLPPGWLPRWALLLPWLGNGVSVLVGLRFWGGGRIEAVQNGGDFGAVYTAQQMAAGAAGCAIVKNSPWGARRVSDVTQRGGLSPGCQRAEPGRLSRAGIKTGNGVGGLAG